jgi:hypothetical protein
LGKRCEDGASLYQNQYKTSNKNKESLFLNQEVKTNRTIPKNKLNTIIRDENKFVRRQDNFRRQACDQKNKPISEDKHVIKNRTISEERHVIKKSRKLL